MPQDFLPSGEFSPSLLAFLRVHLITFIATVTLVVATHTSFPQTLVLALSSPDVDVGDVFRQSRVAIEYLVTTVPATFKRHRLLVGVRGSRLSRWGPRFRVTRFAGRRDLRDRGSDGGSGLAIFLFTDGRNRGVVVLGDIQQTVRSFSPEMLLEKVFEHGTGRIEGVVSLYRHRDMARAVQMLLRAVQA
jgi:hypothetical protein